VAKRVGSTNNSGMSIRSWSFWSEEKKLLAVVSMTSLKRLQPILNSRLTAKRPPKMGYSKIFNIAKKSGLWYIIS